MQVHHGPLVPFNEAEPQTKADFLAGLSTQRNLDGNPKVWLCTVCEARIKGDDILISSGLSRFDGVKLDRRA